MGNKTLASLVSLPLMMMGSVSALADEMPNPNDIHLGMPAIGGSGCPGGSASAALSPDGKALSIIFDHYQVDAGNPTGKSIDRKTCDIGIPVHVPQGYAVSILQVDYRGFNALPVGAYSQFDVNYFFAGTRGPAFAKGFRGPLNSDFLISNPVVGESVAWSSCGADVTLRVNSSMQVQTNSRFDQAMATVDSTDVKASLVYQLQWKRCGGGGVTPTPTPPQPNPYPPQPLPLPDDPRYYSGNCRIDQDPYRGEYLIRDMAQNLVGRASSYQEAVDIAERADREGRCLRTFPSNPFPPRPIPNPIPIPFPHPNPMPLPFPPRPIPGPNPMPLPPPHFGGHTGGMVTCVAYTPFGEFTGTGYDIGQATASARSACIQAVNNSRPCNAASVSCY